MTDASVAPAGLATAPRSHGAVVVLGVARNCAGTLPAAVRGLQTALAGFSRVFWFVVESDSDDDSVAVLQGLAASVPDFGFASMGRLRDAMPLRTQRIAHCRNVGLQRLREAPELADVPYTVVADLDGVNGHLTAAAVATCFGRSDWDACMANQCGPYYDVWALRHPVWCAEDCWQQARFLAAHGADKERAKMAAVFSRMVRIAEDAPWLEVDSAFGGFALYRSARLRQGRYDGVGSDGGEVCEHVAMHAGLRAAGARLFINPALVNSDSAHLAQHWPERLQLARAGKSRLLGVLLRLFYGRTASRQLRRLLRSLS